MPGWKPDASTTFAAAARAGKLIKEILFTSQALGYQVTYSVYLPYQYDPQKKYPVLYVTDGYEYLHENMGNISITLNNLIHQKAIRPVVAVLVDHREPVNRSNNQRMTKLALNEKYLQFFITELLPAAETNYSVSQRPQERAIIGTSMGGLTAAYFSFSRPDVFGLAGIQSPAFWFKPEIYALCENPEKPPVKVFMSTGIINETEEGARKMKSILDKTTCAYQYEEVNQGHSWGNWRDLLDDILIYFFAVN
jgi:enterochelin esterase family protein